MITYIIYIVTIIILALVSVLAIKAIYRGIEAKKKLNKDYNYENKKNIDKKN
tara:strand:+ start:139 stop:294 length:156 start_codon:yes stop_codon:yes gene_type:complete